MVDAAVLQQRPLLRGIFHHYAAIAAVAGMALLLYLADSAAAYVGGTIFAVSLILLYGNSAVYHRVTWSPTLRSLFRRLDHSMIFVLTGGTYTPLCLIVLNTAWGISVLSVIWALAGAGIVMNVAWPAAPKWLRIGLYATLGWLALVPAVAVVSQLAPGALALLALGGVMYTVGGMVYGLRRPDPWPRVLGYHEVFHLLVILGSVLHYSMIAVYVLPG
jgi:hemolysin III